MFELTVRDEDHKGESVPKEELKQAGDEQQRPSDEEVVAAAIMSTWRCFTS
jgi:hypothetical protein